MSRVAPNMLFALAFLISYSAATNNTTTTKIPLVSKFIHSPLESHQADLSMLKDKSGRAISVPDAIRYHLYNRRNDSWVRMPLNGTVPKGLWKPRSPIKILLHGFNGRTEREPFQVMENMMIIGREYGKKNESYNIVAVDWTALATRPVIQYPEAARNTFAAGIAIANYLMLLRSNKAFKRWSRIHMIGFSLGAHVSGVCGQEIQRLTGGRKIGRITGLDPAGPEFDKTNLTPSDMMGVLDKSDAHYTDVLHCNARSPDPLGGNNMIVAVLAGQYGSYMNIAHADFYPNGGERQAFQCDEISDRGGCSHRMCALYYALSITTELPGCPCRSWAFFMAGLCACWTGDNGKAEYMGDLSNRRGTARGKYFLVVQQKVDVNYFLN